MFCVFVAKQVGHELGGLQESKSNNSLSIQVAQYDKIMIHPNPALIIQRAHVAFVANLQSLDSRPTFFPKYEYLVGCQDICRNNKEINTY